jgi:anti-sigma B factor antagonist
MNCVELMDVNVEKVGSIIVVEMFGELDSVSAPDVQAEVLPLADDGSKVLLDMSNVTYMSSAGLRILLLLYRRINENVGKIVLIGLNEEVKDVMAITGFLDFFDVAADRHSALVLLD